MKKLKAISLLSIGAISILGTSVFAAKGIVEAPSGLVLRSSASKTANPITTLSDKTEVEIIQEEGDWYKVTYNSSEGYLFKEYVTKQGEVEQAKPEENEATEQEGEQVQSQIQTNIKVYKIPVISSTVISEIEANQTVEIIKQITNWSYIKFGETEGWARTAIIKGDVQIEAAQPETEEPKPEETPEIEPETTPEPEPVPEPAPEAEPEAKPEVEEPVEEVQQETTATITKGYVNVDYANVRKEATTSSDIVTTLTRGTSFTVRAETEEWYKIQYMSPEEVVYDGYIFKELVSQNPVTTSRGNSEVRQEEVQNNVQEEAVTEATPEIAPASSVVDYAKQYLGYAYVYGGTKPGTGFDCTGFTYYVYNACGYNLSRSCSVQAKSGVAVARAELQPGDLLLFDNTSDGSIGHVGIYTGNGDFIHAANPRRGVVIDTIESGYYNTYYYSARRINK